MTSMQRMEAMRQPPSEQASLDKSQTRRTALFTGLISGLVISVLDIIHALFLFKIFTGTQVEAFISRLASSLGPTNAGVSSDTAFMSVRTFVYDGSIYLLLFLALFLAGLFAAHKTRKISAGVLAGLCAGLVFLVSDLVIANFLLSSAKLFPEWYAALHGYEEARHARSFTVAGAFAYSLVLGFGSMLVSLALGGLGGLVGKGRLLRRSLSRYTALFVGLIAGLVSGVIDFVYAFLLSYTRFSLGQDIPPYLWPAGENAPYFNAFWTLLYDLPIYIPLLLVFLLVGFITMYKTRKLMQSLVAALWTGVAFLVLDFVLAKYFVFSSNISGQLGSGSTPAVANGVITSAFQYCVVATLILTILGLGLSYLGGLLARAFLARAQSSGEPRSRL